MMFVTSRMSGHGRSRNMMNKTILALVLLLALGSSPSGAQQRARERARETLPLEVFQGIEVLAAEAARAGIPQGPLFKKALEGMAKRVPANRLLPAVNMYAGRLRQARGAFGEGADEALVVAGADALQRGVNPEALGRLREGMEPGARQGRGPSPMAVLVLADLIESGVPPDQALGVLREAMRQRARDRQMLGLTGQVRHLMNQGQSPQQAAEQIRRALGRGRGGGMGPPIPPGSEPPTSGRMGKGKGKGKGGG
jgi:hypothetical protein